MDLSAESWISDESMVVDLAVSIKSRTLYQTLCLVMGYSLKLVFQLRKLLLGVGIMLAENLEFETGVLTREFLDILILHATIVLGVLSYISRRVPKNCCWEGSII